MLAILTAIAVAAFPVVVTVAACYDVLTMTIPNRLCLILAGAFLAAAALSGLGLEALGIHLLIGAAILAGTFALFAFDFIGGGDAKLAAVIGLWLGPEQSLPFLVYTALFGGALSLAILAIRAVPLPVFLLRQAWVLRLYDKDAGVPYGVALAAATLLVFPQTSWFSLFVAW